MVASKSTAPAKPRAAAPAAAPPTARPAPRLAAALTPSDIDRAREDALLQLRIGRDAHYYAVVVSAVLLFDALLVLIVPPTLTGPAARSLGSLYFLFLPIVGGLYLALVGLRVKWEDYQIWPWEPHFSVTVAAVVADVLLFVLTLGAVFHVGPTAHWSIWPWFYPLTLGAVSLPLVGLALTWSEWSQRKSASVIVSILPAFLALAVVVPGLSASRVLFAIALTLASAAVLFQMAGSLLHLIASGTRAHEREVLLSGQDRLAQVAGELSKREEAVRFREASLIGREADVENAEIGIQRKLEAIEESRARADRLEGEVQTRSSTITRLQRELAVKLAETNSRARTLEDVQNSIALREKDVDERAQKLAQREQDALGREGSLVEREASVKSKSTELDQRAARATELDARLTARRQEIDRKTAELLEREATVARNEGPAPATSTPAPAKPAGPDPELEAQRSSLAAQTASLKDDREALAKARAETDRRAEELQRRESRAAQREAEAAERAALAQATAKRYEEALKVLEQKSQGVDTKAAVLVQRAEEVALKERQFEEREKSSAARQAELLKRQEEADQRIRDLSVQQKTVAALEDELRLARQSAATKGITSPEYSLAFAAVPPAGFARSARRTSGSPGGDPVVPDSLPADRPAPPPEEPPRTVRQVAHEKDRAPTGTPRLDDLLVGGIPPHGNVMLIGDAFVGKEVVAYGFLAEGLKLGEAAVIVTASRTPDEIAQKIGLVAPQFHEYEQLGMVRWVDACTASATGEAGKGVTRFKTGGPQDHVGILSALVKAANAFEDGTQRPMRVAFLGLSAVLAHADDRQRIQFVQNVLGVLKSRPALVLYTLESGTLPETQLETVLSKIDGAIYFKQDGGKTFLSVQGLGEVQTREWIEYRATNRALVIGSFALERIR